MTSRPSVNNSHNPSSAGGAGGGDALRSRRTSHHQHNTNNVVSPIFARSAAVDDNDHDDKDKRRYHKTIKKATPSSKSSKRPSSLAMQSPTHNFLLGGQSAIAVSSNPTRSKRNKSKFQARRLQQQRMRQCRMVAILCVLMGVVVSIVWLVSVLLVSFSHRDHSSTGLRKPLRQAYSDPSLSLALAQPKGLTQQWFRDLHEARHTHQHGGRWAELAQQLLTVSDSAYQLPKKAPHKKKKQQQHPIQNAGNQKAQQQHMDNEADVAAADGNNENKGASPKQNDKDASDQKPPTTRIQKQEQPNEQQQRKLTAKDPDKPPQRKTTANAPPPADLLLESDGGGAGHRNEQPVPAVAPKPKTLNNEEERPFPVRAMTNINLSHHHEPVPATQQARNVATQPSVSTSSAPLRTLADYDTNHNQKKKELTSSCPPLTSSSAKAETTLVIQSSLDRAWILQETCRRWSDPIVAVLVLGHLEAHQDYAHWLPQWRVKCPQMTVLTFTYHKHKHTPDSYPVNVLRNLGLDAVRTSHVLVADVDFVPSHDLPRQIRDALALRQTIRQSQDENQNNQSKLGGGGGEALIVPAFERVCDSPEDCTAQHKLLQHNSSYLPQTFEDLRGCLLTDKETGQLLPHKNKANSSKSNGNETPTTKCSVFQNRDNWEGHHSTNSPRWLAKKWYQNDNNETGDDAVKDLIQLNCFDSLRYEPYLVIPWCPAMAANPQSNGKGAATTANTQSPAPLAPYYDERFHGYGKNKIQYLQHLRFLQFAFYILPQGFLVHNPHPESNAKTAWNHKAKSKKEKGSGAEEEQDHNKEEEGSSVANTNVHKEMDQLYTQFLNELARLYEQDSKHSWLTDYPGVVGLCPETKEFLRKWSQKQPASSTKDKHKQERRR